MTDEFGLEVPLEKRPGVLEVGKGRLYQFVVRLVEIFLGHGAGCLLVRWVKSRDGEDGGVRCRHGSPLPCGEKCGDQEGARK
jgi:hypothetical protein